MCVGSAQVLGFPGPLDSGKLGFGPYSIPESQVFFATASSFAFVNIRPTTQGELYCLGAGVLLDAPSLLSVVWLCVSYPLFVAGHCLVAPRRRVARFADMVRRTGCS